jgi:prepilin-type N-terminal cleavage/methylation domain-containing protein
MKTGRSHRLDAGFTLVELIIASGIIGVSIAMAMGSLISVSTAQRTTEADAFAAAHVSSVLEEIRALSALEDVFTYIPADLPGLGASEVVTYSCVDSTNTEIALPLAAGATRPTVPNPMVVRVTITWNDQEGRVRAIQAATLHRRL